MDFGISGFASEPRGGYRSRAVRDRELQAFCDGVWQRHEATHARGGPIGEWPNRQTFKTNWPIDAFRLIVADWKIAEDQAAIGRRLPTLHTRWRYPRKPIEIVAELAEELLDPPDPPEVDWRSQFAAQLASHPELLYELSPKQGQGPGDGIELVLERVFAGFPGQRAAIRGWLQHHGTVDPPYGGVIPVIAKELNERAQTVGTNLRNGLERLRWLGQADAERRGKERRVQHGLVSNRGLNANGHARRASAADVPAAAGASDRARRQQGSGRGSRSGRIRDLPSQAS